MTIQADRAVFFSVVEQVLNDVYDTEVSVVTPNKSVTLRLVSFVKSSRINRVLCVPTKFSR